MNLKSAFAVIFLFGSCAMPARGAAIPQAALDISRHDISLSIQPEDHMLRAVDHLAIQAKTGGRCTLYLGTALEIEKLLLDGRKIPFQEITGTDLRAPIGTRETDEEFIKNARGFLFEIGSSGRHVLEIHYAGVVYDTLRVPTYSRGTIPEETTGIIGGEGVFLSPETHWYPDQPDDYAFFTIRVSLPHGFASVTEGKLVARRDRDEEVEDTWDVSYPTKGLYLVAGNYVIRESEAEGVKIMACFFPSEEDLIDRYLEASAKYISMYNRLIGPYAFSKFAVVENFFPTGYGMPSFTLLGRRVVRLPFIVHTSLGHEVVHNWWGNCVYPDYDKGNWCEGLTVYFADYRYKAAISDSAALDYRRSLNIDFTSYVHEDNDFPLSQFRERTTPASRAIGYGKCAMMFHMLKRRVGEEAFYRAFRNFYENYQFKEASWEDIRETVERASGHPLKPFFDQWVYRKGAPVLSLDSVSVDEGSGAGFRVSLVLKQEPLYELHVPISITGEQQTFKTDVPLSSASTVCDLTVDFEPRVIAVDPGHDVFRRLDPLDIPPTISRALGDEKARIILPSRATAEKRDVFLSLANQLGKTGEGQLMVDTTVTESDIRASSVILLGGPLENSAYAHIDMEPDITLARDHFSIGGVGYAKLGHSAFITFRNPLNPGAVICAVVGNSAESVRRSGHKIIHYGRYSYVTFLDGGRVKAGVFSVKESPLMRRIGPR